MDFSDLVHRRQNPLTGRWVLVSPHRTKRPWLGQIEPQAAPDLQVHDANCYLCPGNKRANGATNPNYEGPWAFQNDSPALLLGSNADIEAQDLFRAEVVSGECRVICFSPNHSLTLPQLSKEQVRCVIDCWAAAVPIRTLMASYGLAAMFLMSLQLRTCDSAPTLPKPDIAC